LAKKIIALALTLLLAAALSACDLGSLFGGPTVETIKDDPLVGDGTSYSEFIKIMDEIRQYGDRAAELGLPVNSEYYYSYAGASVSAFRYAVEYILWLKGEGGSFADYMAESRYAGWELIAEINYSSPYPSYFEGLLLEIQGKYDESIAPFAAASIMPMFPEEGLDFYYLKKMSVDALYEVRDVLRQLEERIYTNYAPVLTGREWDKYMFDAEYLMGLSANSVKASEYEAALYTAQQALKVDPADVRVWQNAAACAIYAEQLELAGGYVDEGLTVFPEDEELLRLKQMFISAVEDMEGVK